MPLFPDGENLQSPPPAPKPLPPHLQELVDLLPLNVAVHRSDIAEKYGVTSKKRSEYARRIRKIISEYGWDIETRRGPNGANDDWYIRRSDGPVRPQHIRYEVPRKMREAVYERDGWTCRMCRTPVGPEQRQTLPQCDHKIPQERWARPARMEELQTLCTRCNLKKRQACAACTLSTCDGCPFAYPEEFDDVFVLQLGTEAAERLRAAARRASRTPDELVARLARRL